MSNTPLPEPAYYQWRRKKMPWSLAFAFSHMCVETTDDSEVRTLHTADQMHAHAAAVSAAKDAQIAALRAEVAGLRQDAERYRWLRDGDLNADYPYPVMRVGGDGHDYAVWFEELDAAIDAALAARKGEA